MFINPNYLCGIEILPVFADVILPLALPKRVYTYQIPDDLLPQVRPGVRVEVPFGPSKLYSGLVERLHNTPPDYRTKAVSAVLDEEAVVTPQQMTLWNWMADYYCCTLGEVMAAALPGYLKLTSETRLVFSPTYGDDFVTLEIDEYLIAEALSIQREISIDDARKILNKKTVFPVIQSLMRKGVLFLREDLQEKYKPRKVMAVRLAEPYRSNQELLGPIMNDLEKYEKQTEVLLAYLVLSRGQPFVRRQEVLDKAGASDSALKSLVKKNILELFEREISRVAGYEDEIQAATALSKSQQQALTEIEQQFTEKKVVLLHGVTGSGKTRLYTELMEKIRQQGGQTLYLLPEIALTTQMINRLQRVFGDAVSVYHSKINYNERVELWRSAASGKPVILSARSGLFLPFQNLQLIIVDEEHDPSFKQYDPAPRYHARDTAIYLAQLYGAKTLLGTATPGVETYHNAQTGKYGLVTLAERFGGLELPAVQTVDLRQQLKTKQMQGIFSTTLVKAVEEALARGEQVILFQNRRGYSPILSCQVCGWNATCRYCDVSLTYHQRQNHLRCHYCGYQEQPAAVCPACGSGKLSYLSFGTEKIEDDLKILLPQARIGRLDLDTASTKNNLSAILNDFEERRIDILVGTQMVTKGLDFDNVGIVGVIGADQLLRFPDFRAGERAYQLLTQVAGRAGRKHKQGQVLLQTYDPTHPILKDVLRGDFQSFILREMKERHEFRYPPFYRLIHLTVQHKDEKTAANAAAMLGKLLRANLGDRVMGPVLPRIPRLRNYYGQEIMLKLERDAKLLSDAKGLIRHTNEVLVGQPGWSQLRLAVDVDPV